MTTGAPKDKTYKTYKTYFPDAESRESADEPLPFAEISSRVCEAIAVFYSRDSYLVHANAHERSMTFRLGMYLQMLFPSWDVDCEYNRNRGDVKRIPGQSSVFPDVIIHKRGTQNNLLVIEAKTAKRIKRSPAKANADIAKIEEYILQPGLQYRLGLFWEIRKDVETTCANLKWCVAENVLPVWYDHQGKNILKPFWKAIASQKQRANQE